MQCIIYVRKNEIIPIYTQFNDCARQAKRFGYSIKDKVLDFECNRFHVAVNKVIADNEISILIVHSKEMAFDNNDDYLFFRIYLEKLGKKLMVLN